ncbi:MarR family winged helix-turn-helix transcriptional regulator [Pseudodesulfovibrio sp.]|uniref:MarR family winged helix-turn-helix transcriptional regulator n=1 Tax=unclassified Pseudodesulfovibrio TaxID=2661612 RepID=UPI003AFFA59A
MSESHLDPKNSLGFLAWKVSRVAANDLAARFSAAGVAVTVEQWRALIPLYHCDGLPQGKLCELLNQEKTGVSRLVAGLEKHGLLSRKSGKIDRRIKRLFITEAGRALIDSTLDIVRESKEALVKGVDAEELAVCRRVLWHILQPVFDRECGCGPTE